MSALFGPVVQQGYVVPDVEEAIAHWLSRGVGPFFLNDISDFPGQYDGQPIMAKMRAGFAYSGDQQIEVITPSLDHPSMYGIVSKRWWIQFKRAWRLTSAPTTFQGASSVSVCLSISSLARE